MALFGGIKSGLADSERALIESQAKASVLGQVRELQTALRDLQANQNRYQMSKLRGIAKRARMQYDGARSDRIRADWPTGTNTPYRDISKDLPKLIARSRLAYANDPIYRSAVNVITSNTIGQGLKPKAAVLLKNRKSNSVVNAALHEGWERYESEWDRRNLMTFSEAQALAFRTVMISGGVLCNTVRSYSSSTIIPIQKQLIEQDRLDPSHDYERVTMSNNEPAAQVLHGISVDEYGKPLSFFIKGVDKPVPARNMNHTFLHERPEQYIGTPWGSAVLDQIWDVHQLQEDTLIKSRALADYVWWMEPNGDSFGGSEGDIDSDGNAITEALSFLRTPNRPEIIKGDDSITGSVQPLTKMILNSIAAGLGMSYMSITKDLTDVNFAASRNIVMEERRFFRTLQQWWIRAFLQIEWNDYVFWMCITGQIPQLTVDRFLAEPWRFQRCAWQAEGWDWVDPLKDSNADIAMKSAGLATDKELLGKRGKDVESQYRQLAEERELRKKYGIPESQPVATKPPVIDDNNDDENGEDKNAND
jgi:lambda family phage portal protein